MGSLLPHLTPYIIFILIFQSSGWVGLASEVDLFSGDYCYSQQFMPRCGHNEVIVVAHAHYGRMRLGSCVPKDRGLLGCRSDVLQLAHKKCSGRKSCSIHIPDPDFVATKPCEDMNSYLEISYRCLPVIEKDHRSCSRCDDTKITAPAGGYIASVTSEETRCGRVDCPWILEAGRGQHITVSLIDFAYSASSRHQETGVCQVYANIKEPQHLNSETVCGGKKTEAVAYQSRGNILEIRLHGSGGQNRYFLLKYEFTGCADLEDIPGASASRDGDTTTVTCEEGSRKTFTLRCNTTHWTGTTPRCKTRPEQPKMAEAPPIAAEGTGSPDVSGLTEASSSAMSFTMIMVLVIVIILTIGMVACVSMIGIYCVRKANGNPGHVLAPPPSFEPDYEIYDPMGSSGVKCPPMDFYTLPTRKSRDYPKIYGRTIGRTMGRTMGRRSIGRTMSRKVPYDERTIARALPKKIPYDVDTIGRELPPKPPCDADTNGPPLPAKTNYENKTYMFNGVEKEKIPIWERPLPEVPYKFEKTTAL